MNDEQFDEQFEVFADWFLHYCEQHGVKGIAALHGARKTTVAALYANYLSLVPGTPYSQEAFTEKLQPLLCPPTLTED